MTPNDRLIREPTKRDVIKITTARKPGTQSREIVSFDLKTGIIRVVEQIQGATSYSIGCDLDKEKYE